MAAVLQALLSICALLIILLTSWFVAVLLDYYEGNGRTIKPHQNSNSPPFPSDKMEKIFWFVQVEYYFLLESQTWYAEFLAHMHSHPIIWINFFRRAFESLMSKIVYKKTPIYNHSLRAYISLPGSDFIFLKMNTVWYLRGIYFILCFLSWNF